MKPWPTCEGKTGAPHPSVSRDFVLTDCVNEGMEEHPTHFFPLYRCPLCGNTLYGGVYRKSDGTAYVENNYPEPTGEEHMRNRSRFIVRHHHHHHRPQVIQQAAPAPVVVRQSSGLSGGDMLALLFIGVVVGGLVCAAAEASTPPKLEG